MSKGSFCGLVFAMCFVTWATPQLTVDQTVYDFGEAVEGMVVSHAFVLTNAGDSPLVFLSDPIPGCACTTAPLPKRELPPGESMELVVLFDSTGYGGKQVAEGVTIYTNDPNRRLVHLLVRGYVRPAAEYEKSASALFSRYYLLIDIRSPEAYAQGHLLGAVNIPFSELSEWIDRLPEASRAIPIFLYDETGELAVWAAQFLRENGFYFARAIAGGVGGWQAVLGELFWWGQKVLPREISHLEERAVKPAQVAQAFLLILDLRDPAGYKGEHLPGAVNVDPQDLPAWVWELPRLEDLLTEVKFTVWCLDEDGTVAPSVAQSLRAVGLNAYAMVGGLAQWRLLYGDKLFWSGNDDKAL